MPRSRKVQQKLHSFFIARKLVRLAIRRQNTVPRIEPSINFQPIITQFKNGFTFILEQGKNKTEDVFKPIQVQYQVQRNIVLEGNSITTKEVTKATLKFERLSDKAIPISKLEENAGFDLCSVVNCIIPARGKSLINTGIAIELPKHTYGRIAPRSGLAVNHSIDVGAGVIDQGYRGAIGVILFNHGSVDYEVKSGDRIAQLIVVKVEPVTIVECMALTSSTRGNFGFGSSGR